MRTVAEAVAVAGDDVKAGLGLLDARHVAGDAERRRAACGRRRWPLAAARRPPAARSCATSPRPRAGSSASSAFLLEPDLKEACGGLREGQVLRALAAAQLADEPPADAGEAYALLLDVRDELHRRAGRADRRRWSARSSGRSRRRRSGRADDDALLRQVSLAGRRLAFVADETWRRVRRGPGPPAAAARYRRVRREPLADGRGRAGRRGGARPRRATRPPTRPGAARARPPPPGRTCCSRPYTLQGAGRARARRCPSRGRRRSAGRSCGCWPAGAARCRCWSSWTRTGCSPGCCRSGTGCGRCRSATRCTGSPSTGTWSRPRPRPPSYTRDVDRPDLLLVGALLHDIGKGWPGDHSEVGEPIAARDRRPDGLLRRPTSTIARRAGPPPPAAARHRHPPRPRRPGDRRPGRRRRSAHDAAVLQLLHALAQADGAATGASAWSPWKAHLVAALVARVQARLGGSAAARPSRCSQPTEPQVPAAPAARGTGGGDRRAWRTSPTASRSPSAPPTGPACSARCAGVLALNQLDVRAAKMTVEDGYAHRRVRGPAAVRPGAGAGDPRRRRAGRPGGHAAAGRAAAAARGRLPAGRRAGRPPPRISWHDGEVSGADTGIVEVRAGDRAGLLYRLTAALAAEGLDVTSARIETLGADALDSFYVCDPTGTGRWTRSGAGGSRWH